MSTKVPMKRHVTVTDGTKTETYSVGRPIGKRRDGSRFLITAEASALRMANEVSVNCGFSPATLRAVVVIDTWKDGTTTIHTIGDRP